MPEETHRLNVGAEVLGNEKGDDAIADIARREEVDLLVLGDPLEEDGAAGDAVVAVPDIAAVGI